MPEQKQPGDDAVATRHIKINKSSHVRNAPKWTFGNPSGPPAVGDEKKLTKSASAPSPGQYATTRFGGIQYPDAVETGEHKYQTLPKWGFGTGEMRMGEKKEWDKKKPVPGPGEYPKTGEGKRPGPGAFSPVDPNQTSAAFGFGTASQRPNRRVGSHPWDKPKDREALKSTMECASWKQMQMGARMSGGKGDSVPGPGSYKTDSIFKEVRNHNGTFGTGTRTDALKDQKFPGPGGNIDNPKFRSDPHKVITINSNPCARTGPSFNFRSRRRPVKCDSTPGPVFAPYSQFDPA